MNLSLMRTFKEKLREKFKLEWDWEKSWEENENCSGSKRNSHSWQRKIVVGMTLIFSYFSIFSQFSLNFLTWEKTQFSVYFLLYFLFSFITGTKSALKTFLLSNHFFHTGFFIIHFPPNKVKEKPHFYLYFMMKKFS